MLTKRKKFYNVILKAIDYQALFQNHNCTTTKIKLSIIVKIIDQL